MPLTNGEVFRCHYDNMMQHENISGLVQDCSNSNVLAMELLQPFINSSICFRLWPKTHALIYDNDRYLYDKIG